MQGSMVAREGKEEVEVNMNKEKCENGPSEVRGS